MATAPERMGQLGGRSLARIVYSEQQIQARVEALGREISAAYGAGDRLLVLGLLKGFFIFLADLVRRIERPLQVAGVINAYNRKNIFYYDVFTTRRIDQLPFAPYLSVRFQPRGSGRR